MTFHFCNHKGTIRTFHKTIVTVLCGRELGHDGKHGTWTHVDGRPTGLRDDDVEVETNSEKVDE